MRFLKHLRRHGERHAHGPFSRGTGEGRHHDSEHRGGEHRGRRGGGRAARLFEHGDLRFVLLQLIAEKPRHGYEIIKAIEERVGGSYSPSPGVIYPTLTLLEELGYIAGTADAAGKKQFALAPEGQSHLDGNRPAVEAIFARIADIGSEQEGGPAPQILRSMHALRLALRLRLVRGSLDEAQRTRIAAILDAAARDIEQG